MNTTILETLCQQRIILPALTFIAYACAEAVTRANRRIYRTLIGPLERHHRRSLDNLQREPIDRLKVLQSMAVPDGLGRQIPKNRLLKMAREADAGAAGRHTLRIPPVRAEFFLVKVPTPLRSQT